MVDVFDSETRSWIMAQVRDRKTKPEVAVETALEQLSIRFKRDGAGLPGRPDFVLPSVKLAVFVNGCFWHWHGCKRSRMPESNRKYWESKIARNVRRDRKVRRLLSAQRWHYCTIWECTIDAGFRRLMTAIRHLRDVSTEMK
jgi:DNA mismatch endonuclease, patch repair protein